MSIFDQKIAKPHGCFVCGKRSEMSLTVSAGKIAEGSRNPKVRISRTRSYCQTHGEAVFKQMLAHREFDRAL